MQIKNISDTFSLPTKDITAQPSQNFEELVKDFVLDVNGDLHASTQAQKKLIEGKVGNMVELMSTIEKADISLRLLTEIRNKAIEAYQDIMRMQV